MHTSDMTSYAVVDATTGLIIREGRAEVGTLADVSGEDCDVIAPIPEGISDDTHYWDGEAFQRLPARPGAWAEWDGRAWIDRRTEADLAAELADARSLAVDQINAEAGRVRLLHVTDIPGQQSLYLEKAAEAKRYLALLAPVTNALLRRDYPLISAEVGITGTTPQQVAQVFLNRAASCTAAMAALETARMRHVDRARAAATANAAAAEAQAFHALYD